MENNMPWEQINKEKAAVLMAALNDYKTKTFGRELAILADLESEIPQAFNTVEILYTQRDELLAMLREAKVTMEIVKATLHWENINAARLGTAIARTSAMIDAIAKAGGAA